MIRRLLDFFRVPLLAVPAGSAPARSARFEAGHRIDAPKDYTTAPGDWKLLVVARDAFALAEGVRLPTASRP